MTAFRYVEEEWYPVLVPAGHPTSYWSADDAFEDELPDDVVSEYVAAFEKFTDARERMVELLAVSPTSGEEPMDQDLRQETHERLDAEPIGGAEAKDAATEAQRRENETTPIDLGATQEEHDGSAGNNDA